MTISLTALEIEMLVALRNSEYQQGTAKLHVVGCFVWSFSACDSFGASAGGIASSLVKKGCIRCEDNDSDDEMAMTEAGWDALEAVLAAAKPLPTGSLGVEVTDAEAAVVREKQAAADAEVNPNHGDELPECGVCGYALDDDDADAGYCPACEAEGRDEPDGPSATPVG